MAGGELVENARWCLRGETLLDGKACLDEVWPETKSGYLSTRPSARMTPSNERLSD